MSASLDPTIAGAAPTAAMADRLSLREARRAGLLRDLIAVARRAVRQVVREPAAIIPALVIPVFFFVVNVGALQKLAGAAGTTDYAAFQLPVAVISAVTGVSRANALVTDIATGYFERLLLTPVNRLALLLGLMVADLVVVAALCLPVLVLGALAGVSFATGPVGIFAFVAVAAAWGVAYTGLPYAIALRTGSSAAVASSFILFFPLLFLTTAFVPKVALSGWLATVSDLNPVTYVLASLRSLVSDGWQAGPLLQGLAAIAMVGTISITLAFAALRGRLAGR
ncbi:MAG TPA: ABC transporter permease [Candidatus Sulfotelmatobacter sp.]|nr:ABC transporter permease [Candidatus Sulfotelmatobacter sp.]